MLPATTTADTQLADSLGMDHAELVAAMDQAARDYLRDKANPNTKRSYASDWKVWQRFTAERGLPELIVSFGALVAFTRWHIGLRQAPTGQFPEGKPYAPSTVERRLMGTVSTLRDILGEDRVPKGLTEGAMKEINEYAGLMKDDGVELGRGKAAAVWPHELMALLDHAPTATLLGRRDRALLIVWYYSAARRVEMADLKTRHVIEHPEGLRLVLPITKTGERDPLVPHDGHLDGECGPYCGVRVYREWITASRVHTGRVFRRLDRHGNLHDAGISAESVGDRLAHYCALAGVDRKTGHGMRRGHISTAVGQGKPERDVRRQTGHAPGSKSLAVYYEAADEWTANSAVGLLSAGYGPERRSTP